MDSFIDKLADLLRTLLGDGDKSARRRSSRGGADAGGDADSSADETFGGASRDPDLREAWDELNDYMKGGSGDSARRAHGRQSRPEEPRVDESLRPDYANLEVPFGSGIETVRASYKSLILKYHPDKHAGDPEKLRVALEITKKINESFERIRSRQGAS